MRRSLRSARSTCTSTSKSGGRAVISAPSSVGLKEKSSGAFQSSAAGNPLGGVSAAEDPSGERGGEGSLACSRHDKSPVFPRRVLQKRCLEGSRAFDTSLGVLVREHGIHILGSRNKCVRNKGRLSWLLIFENLFYFELVGLVFPFAFMFENLARTLLPALLGLTTASAAVSAAVFAAVLLLYCCCAAAGVVSILVLLLLRLCEDEALSRTQQARCAVICV